MARKQAVLEFAILGVLHEEPMHGYELRKRLNALLGAFRAISYGSLYPCLKDLEARGLIRPTGDDDSAPALTGKRARVVYALTAEGKEHFNELTAEAGPETWDDEPFAAHLAFFSRTHADIRLRILEGRRSRLEERMSNLRESLARTGERLDSYTLTLQEHGLDGIEREVRWLNELIQQEDPNSGEGRS